MATSLLVMRKRVRTTRQRSLRYSARPGVELAFVRLVSKSERLSKYVYKFITTVTERACSIKDFVNEEDT